MWTSKVLETSILNQSEVVYWSQRDKRLVSTGGWSSLLVFIVTVATYRLVDQLDHLKTTLVRLGDQLDHHVCF